MFQRFPSRYSTGAVVALLTAGAYVAFFAWDGQKAYNSDGYRHGPYDVWQVAAVVIVIASAAVWAGLRRHTMAGAVAATTVLTGWFSFDAATDARNDGIWPVGATMVFVGTMLGFLLISTMAAKLSDRVRSRKALRVH